MIIEDDTIISKELYELLVNADYEALILKDFSNAKEEILKSKHSVCYKVKKKE